MKKTILGLVMTLGSLALGTGTAKAVPFLDFNDFGLNGGTVSFNPATHTITGSGIPLGLLHAIGTTNDGVVVNPLVNAILSFTMTGVSFNAATQTYSNSGGGTLSIDGKAPGVASGNIETGTFGPSSSPFTANQVNFGGLDTKNVNLLAVYGLASTTTFTFTGFAQALQLITLNTDTGAFTTTGSFSTDVSNFGLPPVPEPMSVILLGTAMLGIATMMRRRQKASDVV